MTYADHIALASIGPPRERGGKNRPHSRTRAASARFNWATPRTGWKVLLAPAAFAAPTALQLGHPANGVERRARERGAVSSSRCFNWATPRTGWKVSNGSAGRWIAGRLQLGHPANGVERRPSTKLMQATASGFNWATPRTGWKAPDCRPCRKARKRFNWATPRTGWKDPCGDGGCGCEVALQLGHPANGVESLRG